MAQRVTQKHIEAWIAEGRGYGHGPAYIPWIKIRTRGSPTGGNLQFRYIPELGRYAHLLSAGELKLARLLLYLGVADLREQYPCWPWKHPHPLFEHPHFNPSPIPWSKGTLACAEKLQINHPRYPGTMIYHIPSIDLLATIRVPGNYQAVAFAVKPDPNIVELDEWAAAKLSIQATYCEELLIPWHLVSSNLIPDTLSENLKILLHYSGPNPALDDTQKRFTQRLLTCLSTDSSLNESLEFAIRTENLSRPVALELFHRALWSKTLPIDLRQPWVFSMPPVLTDGAWIVDTKRTLLGG